MSCREYGLQWTTAIPLLHQTLLTLDLHKRGREGRRRRVSRLTSLYSEVRLICVPLLSSSPPSPFAGDVVANVFVFHAYILVVNRSNYYHFAVRVLTEVQRPPTLSLPLAPHRSGGRGGPEGALSVSIYSCILSSMGCIIKVSSLAIFSV